MHAPAHTDPGAVSEVLGPRHVRGRRHAWPLLLKLIAAAPAIRNTNGRLTSGDAPR
jgi:hypothetical protein